MYKKIILIFSLLIFSLVGCKKVENNNIVTPIGSKKVVIRDFWAPWCPPCKRFSPTFDSWKEKYSNENVTFLKHNVDEEEDLAVKYKVSAIPYIVVEVDGKIVATF